MLLTCIHVLTEHCVTLNFSLNKKFARGICQNALLEGILIKWAKDRKNSGNLVSGGKGVEFFWVVSCI